MPVTVRGTDILFNDGTTQATAAGAPTTTQVLNATAAAAVGAVGTYASLFIRADAVRNVGATFPGSSLAWSGVVTSSYGNAYATNGGAPAGTWRLMGFISNMGSVWTGVAVFLRIS